MKKKLFKGLKILGIVLLVLILGGFIYLNMSTYEPSSEASALLNHEQVNLHDDYYVVMPVYEEIGTFVYYPGGLVEPASYLPFAMKLAEEGIRVIVMKMPLNLAILKTDAFWDLEEQDFSGSVFIGGHSLGGASASLFLKEYEDLVDGLILLASYPAASADLSESDLPVLSISGSLDGVMDKENYEATKSLLPSSTHYVEIPGANHAQFGDYGFQSGDNEASISRESQQNTVVALIKEFVEGIND